MRKFLPVVLIFLMAPTVAWSQSLLQVSSLNGRVEIRPAAGRTFQALAATRPVQIGDEIKTGPGSSVVLTLPDTSLMVVNENTDLIIKDTWSSGLHSIVNVLLGRVRFDIQRLGGRPNPSRVETPTAVIAVKGTVFDVDVDGTLTTEVLCIEGRVGVESTTVPGREVILNPGMHTMVAPGQSPVTPVAENVQLERTRTLQVVKQGAEENNNTPLDPKTLQKLLKDNDRANRPTDRNKAPTSGTDTNVGRAKMTFPE